MIKVKANEALFNKWKSLGEKMADASTQLGVTGSSIVQNDLELKGDDILRWKVDVQKYILELEATSARVKKLIGDTMLHIVDNQDPQQDPD